MQRKAVLAAFVLVLALLVAGLAQAHADIDWDTPLSAAAEAEMGEFYADQHARLAQGQQETRAYEEQIPSERSASPGPPMVKYWRAGALEDAKTQADTMSYVKIRNPTRTVPPYIYAKLYSPGSYRISCVWSGFPYAADVGDCSMGWTMWDNAHAGHDQTCWSAGTYRKTVTRTLAPPYCQSGVWARQEYSPPPPAAPPTATTLPGSVGNFPAVTLKGTVVLGGGETAYYIQYGSNSSMPSSTAPMYAEAGNTGTRSVAVDVAVTTAGSVYFRVVAETSTGTVVTGATKMLARCTSCA